MSVANNRPLSVFTGIIGEASNIRIGSNPPFSLGDFLTVYPQFGPDANGQTVVPQQIVQMYINLADACVMEARWHAYWQTAMGWFIAHFCTLFLLGAADPNGGAAAALAAGQAKGLNTSESVGDVSVSMDYGEIGKDLDGWAAWKLTIYGQQLATIAKMLGRAGMYIY
ncbi:DUF4054 domain-containing protein [Paenibacillus tyrfis]|uniref:DUF4054 domain-containing protein n=1 Tax=Paenibacillus tyrfis TaxID=1501230 RepID=UPI000B58AEC9|nr:DUF4054 domain-containing protein [Paenibacillus tyrfis]